MHSGHQWCSVLWCKISCLRGRNSIAQYKSELILICQLVRGTQYPETRTIPGLTIDTLSNINIC